MTQVQRIRWIVKWKSASELSDFNAFAGLWLVDNCTGPWLFWLSQIRNITSILFRQKTFLQNVFHLIQLRGSGVTGFIWPRLVFAFTAAFTSADNICQVSSVAKTVVDWLFHWSWLDMRQGKLTFLSFPPQTSLTSWLVCWHKSGKVE